MTAAEGLRGMTIVEFLTAQLDREEAITRPVAEFTDRWELVSPPLRARDTIDGGNGVIGDLYPGYVEHILEWQPHRVLAEVAAKRAILALAEDLIRYASGSASNYDAGRSHTVSATLMLLAQPYAEHPEFDPAWRTT